MKSIKNKKKAEVKSKSNSEAEIKAKKKPTPTEKYNVKSAKFWNSVYEDDSEDTLDNLYRE